MKKQEQIKKLAESAEKERLVSFLTDILMEDEKLFVRFKSVMNGNSQEDISQFTSLIDDLVYEYSGRYDYIDYRSVPDFVSDLSEFLDKDVKRMIDEKKYLSAFELSCYIFLTIDEVEMDDDADIEILAGDVSDYWNKILAKVSSPEKKKMFAWFREHLCEHTVERVESFILDIFMGNFPEPEYKQDKLALIEQRIEKISKANDNSYELGEWVVRYLNLLRREHGSAQNCQELYQKYWSNRVVREHYIDSCISKKDYENALRALDECMQIDSNLAGVVGSCAIKKKEIYFLQGNKEAYIKQLWEVVLSYSSGDLDFYRELKSQYSAEEWIVLREEVFKTISSEYQIARLYLEEKLYDRLLSYVLKSDDIYTLSDYTDVLKKDYPEQLLEKYNVVLNEMALQNGDRKKYQRLVYYLRMMLEIKGGSKMVNEICSKWREIYKKRPAMMEEIGRL